jgi:O-antigen ligase
LIPLSTILDRLRVFSLHSLFLFLPIAIAGMEASLGWLLLFSLLRFRQVLKIPSSPVHRPILVLLGSFVVSSLLSPLPKNSLASYHELWTIVSFFLIYAAIQGPKQLKTLIGLMLAVASVIAVYAIAQHFTGMDLFRDLAGRPRKVKPLWHAPSLYAASGFFPNYLTFANNFLFPFCFLTAIGFTPERLGWIRGAVSVAWALVGVSLFLSTSRGIWLGFLMALSAIFFARGSRTFLLSLGTVVLVLALGAFLSTPLKERVASTISRTDLSNQSRVQILLANVAIFRDYTIGGIGYGNYKLLRDPYYDRYPDVLNRAHSHNNFLQIAVESGLVGLGAFLYLYWVIVCEGVRTQRILHGRDEIIRSIHLGALMGVLGFLGAGLTEYNFGDTEVEVMMWSSVALLMWIRKWALSQELSTRTRSG